MSAMAAVSDADAAAAGNEASTRCNGRNEGRGGGVPGLVLPVARGAVAVVVVVVVGNTTGLVSRWWW